MSTQRVVFAGKSLPGFDRDTAIQNLARLLKRTPEQAAAAFNGKDVVIKKGVPAAEAERLCQALERVGLMVHAEAESGLALAADTTVINAPASTPAAAPAAPLNTVPAGGVAAPNLSLVDYEEPEAAKAPTPQMVCPACNRKQDKAEICVACGVVIAKFLQRQAAAKTAAKPAPAAAPAEAPAKKPLGGLLGGLLKRRADDADTE